jgi:DUF218 domain-containing protein
MSAYDAILIPGGGVRSGGVLPPWVTARFDRALEVAGGAWFLPLSGGTTHRPPPLDARGFPISEAQAGAAYLVARGVDRRRILVEASSYDTIGNAWFSRVVHAIPRGFERLLVVNSAFHMPRTEAVFRWVYDLDGPGSRCVLEFEAVPDIGIAPEVLRARLAKEAASMQELDALRSRIMSLRELHDWLFTEHAAYSAHPRSPGDGSQEILETY